MNDAFLARLHAVIAPLADESRADAARQIDALAAAGVQSESALWTAASSMGFSETRRGFACWLIARLDDPAGLPALLRALDDEASTVRAEAARGAGSLGRESATRALLVIATTDPRVEVRTSAVYGLGETRDARAFDPLLAILQNAGEDSRVRGQAAEVLGHFGGERALESLIAALADPSAEVRYWSAFALGEIGDPRALPALRRAADDAATPDGRGSVGAEARAAIELIAGRDDS